ncbi:hypothetical protein [Priestia aryabhattai]|uniref:hypothetical protein n=1 Tax=Priestia aryabhattai TaxID=412384 RepID=UPI002E1D5C5D|nr:hypothetical protein [Priestia aryabhattai]
MQNIGELRHSIKQNLIKKQDGTGIIDLKEIHPININKFLDREKKYFNSYELWLKTKEIYKDELENEIRYNMEKFNLPYDFVEREFIEAFRPPVYDGSMCEAISLWNIRDSKGWLLFPVSKEEDRKFKIDIRAFYVPRQKLVHFQIKKYRENLPKEEWEKIQEDLKTAEKKYGKRPELIFIEFDETDKSKRNLMWTDENGEKYIIPFKGTFGRGRNFQLAFENLLEKIISQNKYN